jgi:hypothetical protein
MTKEMVRWFIPALLVVLLGCSSQSHIRSVQREVPAGVMIFEESERHDVRTVQDLQVVRFVQCNDKYAAAVIIRDLPRFMSFGRVKLVRRPEQVMQFVGDRQPHIYLPRDGKINAHLLLVRKLGTKGWKVFHVPGTTTEDGGIAPISIPDISTLEPLTERADHQSLLSMMNSAQKVVRDILANEP